MRKPRIIIADTDINYILPLQFKFVQEFFEKIDLEIITDQEYFEEMFSTPQTIEILIVSEELYDVTLQKHNLKNIFMMTEQREEEQTAELNVTRIFKYTSTKEIFSEIVGKSISVLNIENSEKKEPQIIVVTSASGGVGKTTIAMGISASLTRNYKKVLYINAEQLQTFQYLLKNEVPIVGNDIYVDLVSVKGNIYQKVKHLIRTEIFNYLPPFKTALMSVGISSDIYTVLAKEAKKSEDFDFIVLDTDSVFDDKKTELLNMADKVVFVTKQNRMSVLATNALTKNINGTNTEKYYYICNDFYKEVDNYLISSQCSVNFTINEYVEHISQYSQMKCSDFLNYTSIQKVAYLFV